MEKEFSTTRDQIETNKNVSPIWQMISVKIFCPRFSCERFFHDDYHLLIIAKHHLLQWVSLKRLITSTVKCKHTDNLNRKRISSAFATYFPKAFMSKNLDRQTCESFAFSELSTPSLSMWRPDTSSWNTNQILTKWIYLKSSSHEQVCV